MNLLAIDASSGNLSLNIIWKDKTVVDFNQCVHLGASSITAHIDKYVKRFSLDLEKIDALVVGAGPGSFTGLRISFAVIKALSIALDKPVISLSSFVTMAHPLLNSHDKVVVISDARKQLIYAASYKLKNALPVIEGREKLTTVMEFIKNKKDYFFITYDDGLRKQILEVFPKINFCPHNVYPNAKFLATLAYDYYRAKKFTPLVKLEPLYLHSKTCQIKTANK